MIIGLGNPGKRYRFTRHNLGFMVVDRLGEELKVKFRRNIFLKAKLAKGRIAKESVILAKPLTFINLSGMSVRRMVDKFSLPYKDILVICDDMNLPLGKLRLRPKGSSGGHKGLASIINYLGSEDFPRLRIGIGEERKIEDKALFVLSNFSKNEEPFVNKALELAKECCKMWVYEGIERAMREFN